MNNKSVYCVAKEAEWDEDYASIWCKLQETQLRCSKYRAALHKVSKIYGFSIKGVLEEDVNYQ